MPHIPSPLPSHLAQRPFTTAEAAASGVSYSRLRSKDVHHVCRGIWVPAGRGLDLHGLARAFQSDDESAVVSGYSAAQLWGMPLQLSDAARPLELTTGTRTHRRSHAVVRWRRRHIPESQARMLHGVRVTSRVRTWADLARELDQEDLVVIADHLLRHPYPELEQRYEPYCVREDLECAIGTVRVGGPVLTAVLDLARVGADSPPETKMRLACVAAGLPEPEINVPIVDADGRTIAKPDAQWRQYRVSAEYDGAHHRTAQQVDRDHRRRERMAAIGWWEVPITTRDMWPNRERAVRRIRAALERRGWEPT